MAKLSAQIFGKDSGLGDTLNDISKAVKTAGKGVDDLGDKLVKSLTPSSKAASSALDDLDESTREQVKSIATAIQGVDSYGDETSKAGRSARGMASGVNSLDSELKKIVASSKLSASQVDNLSDQAQQALLSTQALSGSVKGLSGSQTKAAATSRAAASGIDEMGDEAGQAAGQLVGAASASELLSLQSSALSVNFGAFTIALRNLTTQVPLLVATLGNLGSALTGVGAAVGGVGLGGLAVTIGGVLAKAREGGANLTDLESVMNSLDQTAEQLQQSFIEAINPLVETRGAIELFDSVMEGLMTTINSVSTAISAAFEGGEAVETNRNLQSLSDTLSGIGGSFLRNIDAINAALGNLVLRLGGDLQSAAKAVFQGLPGVIQRVTDITEELGTIIAESSGEFGQFVDNLSQLGRVVAAGVLPVLNEFFGIIGKVADSLILTDDEIRNATGATENLGAAAANARDQLSGFRIETIASAAKSLALILALNRLAGIFGAIVTPIAAATASLTNFFLAAKSQGAFAGFLLTINRLGSVISNNIGGIGRLSTAFSTLLPPLGESTSVTGALIRRLYATSEAEDEAAEEGVSLATAMRAAASSMDEVEDEATSAAVSIAGLKATMSSLTPDLITNSVLAEDLSRSFGSMSVSGLISNITNLGSVFTPLGFAMEAFHDSITNGAGLIAAYDAALGGLRDGFSDATLTVSKFGATLGNIGDHLENIGDSSNSTGKVFSILDSKTNKLSDKFTKASYSVIKFGASLKRSQGITGSFSVIMDSLGNNLGKVSNELSPVTGGMRKLGAASLKGFEKLSILGQGLTAVGSKGFSPFSAIVSQSSGVLDAFARTLIGLPAILTTGFIGSLTTAVGSVGLFGETVGSAMGGAKKSVTDFASGVAQSLLYSDSFLTKPLLSNPISSYQKFANKASAGLKSVGTVAKSLMVGNISPLISKLSILNSGFVATGLKALATSSAFETLLRLMVAQGGVIASLGGALSVLKAQYVTTGSILGSVSTALGVLSGAGAGASASKILLASATTLATLSFSGLVAIGGVLLSVLTSIATIAGILAGVFLLVVAVVGTAAAALMALGSSGKSAQELIDGLVSKLREIGSTVMPLVVSAGNAMTDVFNSIMAVGDTLVGGLKEIGVALGLINEDAGDGGMMAMFGNAVDMIKPVIDQIGELARTIGSYLTGKITQATDAIVAFIEGNNIAGKIQALVSNFKSLAGPIKSFANTVITAVKPVFNNIISSAQQVTSAIFGIFSSGEGGGLSAFMDMLFNIGNILINSVKAGFKILGAVISALAPVVSFVVDIITGALVGVIGIIGSVIDIFGALLSGIFGSSDEGGGIFETLGSMVGPVISGIKTFGSVLEGIMGIASAIFGPLLSGLASVGSFIVDLIIPYVNYVGDVIGFVFGTAAMVVGGFIDTIVGIFSGAFGFISKILNGNIVAAFMGLGNGIVEFFAGIFGFLKNRIVSFATIIYDLIKGILTTIFDAFTSLPSALAGIFTDIATGIVGAIGNALGMAKFNIPELEIAGKTIMEEKTFSLGGGGDSGGRGGAQSILASNEEDEANISDSQMGKEDLASGGGILKDVGGMASDTMSGKMEGSSGDVNVNEGDSTNIFNQTISAEPEDEVQIGRIAEDAMSEANSFKRRQEGSQ